MDKQKAARPGRFALLVGIGISILLLWVATRQYPGGSQSNRYSVGFDWKDNYLCNLFNERAINGQDNESGPWAVGGMFFLCVSFALFFWQFSSKISSRSAAGIIKYGGLCSMLFAFLTVTPLHDLMVTLSATCALVSMFYITVFVFKSRLFFLKILSVICLLFSYAAYYIYYTRSRLDLLPGLQKVVLLITIIWALCLQYATTAVDFQKTKR